MKILFICKYNAFRSRVAEEYFKKANRNLSIKAKSRGFIMGGAADMNQRTITKKLLGINIARKKTMPVTIEDMQESDLIIVVADDVPRIMFNYGLSPIARKVVIWKVKDEERMREKNIKNITLQIKRNVDNLIKKLEKKR